MNIYVSVFGVCCFIFIGIHGSSQAEDNSKDPAKCAKDKTGDSHKGTNTPTKDHSDDRQIIYACIDLDRCCKVWSSFGECDTNKKSMATNCARSCRICNDTKAETDSSPVCKDISPKCPEWAGKNECKKNVAWMEENCPVSCKTCERSTDDLRVICGARPEPAEKKVCKNYYPSCEKWAKDGDCKDNVWWMGENCPLACDRCDELHLKHK